MFHIREEGKQIHNGFNFYRLSDKSSFGFVFRYGPKVPTTNLGTKTFWVRYSKQSKKWIIRKSDLSEQSNAFNQAMAAYIKEEGKKHD